MKGYIKMKLLTKEILNAFTKQGDASNKLPKDIKIIVKFFNPVGRGQWYASEWIPEEGIFFGFVSLFNDYNDEMGYFSLKELQEYRGPLGLGIERDMHFKPGSYTLQQLIDGERP